MRRDKSTGMSCRASRDLRVGPIPRAFKSDILRLLPGLTTPSSAILLECRGPSWLRLSPMRRAAEASQRLPRKPGCAFPPPPRSPEPFFTTPRRYGDSQQPGSPPRAVPRRIYRSARKGILFLASRPAAGVDDSQ